MIEQVINAINADIQTLGIFDPAKTIGLCEMIDEPFKDGENELTASFPALYSGKDHLRYITNFDYKVGVLFHLPNGAINTIDLDRIQTSKRRIERTWPLKAIAIIRRDIYGTDSSYSAIELISNLEGKISKQTIPALKTILQVEKIKANVGNSSYDKKQIIEETFININFPPVHNLIAVKIEYEVVISGNEQCFKVYGC